MPAGTSQGLLHVIASAMQWRVLLATGLSRPTAAELGMSPSAASHAVRWLEDRLGRPFWSRATRSISVTTEVGTRFVTGVERVLNDIDRGTRAGERAVAN
jgi:DNA-binding transcriptional LysR family regulator